MPNHPISAHLPARPGKMSGWMLRILLLNALLFIPWTVSALGYRHIPAAHQIHPGDEIVLNQTIQVPSGVRVHLQDGRVIARSELKHRRFHCYFHIHRSRDELGTGLRIVSDRFRVTRIQNRVEMAVNRTPFIRVAVGSLMDYSAENMMTVLRLESVLQPAVRELKCGRFAVPFEDDYATLEDIRQILGDVVTLNLRQP